jgi:hypothetical protein
VVAENSEKVVPFRFGHLVGEDQEQSVHASVDPAIAPIEQDQAPSHSRDLVVERGVAAGDDEDQGEIARPEQALVFEHVVLRAVAREALQIVAPEAADRALELEDGVRAGGEAYWCSTVRSEPPGYQ